MTSKLTRERIELIANFHRAMTLPPSHAEIEELARMALAAMDSESVGTLSVRYMSYSGKKIGNQFGFVHSDAAMTIAEGDYPLYRHAQQPVVPDDVLEALQKVARIRLDLNDFDGDRRGIADCLCDAEEALIEVVNRRAAMLAAAPQLPGSEPATAPGKWIPVSERMPESNKFVLVSNGVWVGQGLYDDSEHLESDEHWQDEHREFINVLHHPVTHWMPLPAAPQEVKGE
ncbi:DUF551 domain-containing protein [Klebsiella pneumoniae]|nr:DUF551 domain-containing protein [Klebsiella pneumoniae]MCD9403230.1 DUF551 domain-containing protein [Klebsiella pneumoniae]